MKKFLAVVVTAALVAAPMPAFARKRPPKPKPTPDHSHRTSFDLDGFVADSVTPGTGPGAHSRRVTTFTSPWGERMTVDTQVRHDMIEITIDRDIVVRYAKDDTGQVLAMEVEADGQRAQTFVGNRAQQMAHGAYRGEAFDTSPYELLASSLRGRHSEAFYEGLYAGGKGAALPVCNCYTELAWCVLAITAWVLDLIGLVGGCGAGVGPLCLAAIIGHELASAGVLTACSGYILCLR